MKISTSESSRVGNLRLFAFRTRRKARKPQAPFVDTLGMNSSPEPSQPASWAANREAREGECGQTNEHAAHHDLEELDGTHLVDLRLRVTHAGTAEEEHQEGKDDL